MTPQQVEIAKAAHTQMMEQKTELLKKQQAAKDKALEKKEAAKAKALEKKEAAAAKAKAKGKGGRKRKTPPNS